MGLSKSDSNIWNRTFKSFKNFFLYLPGGFVIIAIFKGFDMDLLLAFIAVMCMFFIYTLIVNRKVLYSVRYHIASNMIELISIRYNHVHQELIASRDEMQILVRQDFSYRTTVWCILFYHKKKLVITQSAISGWDKNMFLEIERNFKKQP